MIAQQRNWKLSLMKNEHLENTDCMREMMQWRSKATMRQASIDFTAAVIKARRDAAPHASSTRALLNEILAEAEL